MARRAQNDKVAYVVVGALTIDVTHLQNVGDAEAAVRADFRVMSECELPIIDAIHPRTGLTTANAKAHAQPPERTVACNAGLRVS